MEKCPKCGTRTTAGSGGQPEWFRCPACGHQWWNDAYKLSSASAPYEAFNSSTGRYEFTDL